MCKYKELRMQEKKRVTIPSAVLTASGSQGIISAHRAPLCFTADKSKNKV